MLAAAVAGAAFAHSALLFVMVLVVQGCLSVSWHRSVSAPGALGGAVLALASGLGAALLLQLRTDARPLGPVTGLLGIATVGVLVHQLFRRNRDRVMASMAATATLVVLTVFAAFHLPARDVATGWQGVALTVLAAAGGHAVGAFALPVLLRAVLVLGVGAAVGTVVSAITWLELSSGLMLGVLAAAAGHLAAVLLARLEHPPIWLSAALPIALAGPVAYAVGSVVSS